MIGYGTKKLFLLYMVPFVPIAHNQHQICLDNMRTSILLSLKNLIKNMVNVHISAQIKIRFTHKLKELIKYKDLIKNKLNLDLIEKIEILEDQIYFFQNSIE
jgi:hypothetical protein